MPTLTAGRSKNETIAPETFWFEVFIDAPEDFDAFADEAFEAGCDDATVSSCNGLAVVHFAREARNFGDALTTAVDNIAGMGRKVLAVKTDWAKVAGMELLANRNFVLTFDDGGELRI